MPKIHVEKSISIKAPAEKIVGVLTNFNDWRPWSPWLIMEPETKVEVASDGKSYTWEGKRIGTGNMSIANQVGNERLDYKLNFLKPWKSKADVQFKLKQEGDAVQVTWSMDSSLPFFMFWMKKMMMAFVGMDYERGLNMLKEYVEEGKVNSKLGFKGISEVDGCSYVAIKTSCTTDEIPMKMGADFEKLFDFVMKDKENMAGSAFTIYDKWDLPNAKAVYTACIPVKNVPSDLPDGIFSGNLPKVKVNTVTHQGAYTHLGNAWMAAYSMGRAKEFKINKKIAPFEIYVNDPREVSPTELLTEINIPAN